MIKLFVDDERFPPNDGGDWYIARSSLEAILYVQEYGVPPFISLDHDLGGDDTACKFVYWMIDAVLDGHIQLPDNFQYYVHSQNPIGAERLRGLMGDLISVWEHR